MRRRLDAIPDPRREEESQREMSERELEMLRSLGYAE